MAEDTPKEESFLNIIEKVQDELEAKLITSISEISPTRAGVVITGPLQGDPDPDQARISVTVYEGDPDNFFSGNITSMDGTWNDEIAETEIGGSAIWNRRFTVKARCLFAASGESKDEARRIATAVKARIERTLLDMSFAGILDSREYVSRPVIYDTMKSEMVQSGGPPDAYDFFIKVRFDVQTSLAV